MLFWNIQRLGGGKGPIGADEIKSDLEGLAAGNTPDIIVLCEALKGTKKAMAFNKEVPSGYSAVKPYKLFGNYKDANTLRYVLMKKNSVTCNGFLIGTGNDRPVLFIQFMVGNSIYRAMVVHAPSVTHTTTAQANQISTAFNKIKQIFGAGPDAIFGDMNVNVADVGKRTKLRAKLPAEIQQSYAFQYPNQKTHDKGATLDWSITKTGYLNSSVVAINPSIDVNMDGDDDFIPPFKNEKGSDHLPILVKL
jgi:hypothetical protein